MAEEQFENRKIINLILKKFKAEVNNIWIKNAP